MPYLNETGLSYYDPKLKEWISSQPSKTLPSSLYPWTLTDKTGAVTCWPVGGTPLLPTVDFLYTETGPASGDKGPDNPSTITGVSSVKVTRCGKNILPYPYADGTKTDTDITFTPASDGSLSINGTAGNNRYYVFARNILFRAGTKIILSADVVSGTGEDSQTALQIVLASGASILKWQYLSNSSTAYTVASDSLVTFRLYIGKNASFTNYVIKPQCEIDENVTTFEPYDGANYTIPLDGTYYGGEIDLATGLMTVTSSGEYLSTFTSFYLAQTNTVSFLAKTSFQHKGNVSSGFTSNRFNYGDYNIDLEHVRQGGSPTTGGKDVIVFIDKTRLDLSAATDPDNPTNAEWLAAANAWLSSNPVFFVSQLFTPTTVQLSPLALSALAQPDKYTPRLNTLYTDASAVQVGYVKSPIREEYELTQAIVAQGGNV